MTAFTSFAGENAKLGLPETGLAIIPGYATNLVIYKYTVLEMSTHTETK
jgi:enoyl-CoA hydratase/carnithine racemase